MTSKTISLVQNALKRTVIKDCVFCQVFNQGTGTATISVSGGKIYIEPRDTLVIFNSPDGTPCDDLIIEIEHESTLGDLVIISTRKIKICNE